MRAKKLKRALGIILMLAMCLTLLPNVAFAMTDYSNFKAVVYSEGFGTNEATRTKEFTFDADGKVTLPYCSDSSFVFVRNDSTGVQYCTDGWTNCANPVTLVNEADLSSPANFEKLYLDPGTNTLYLLDNGDDTFTLSYNIPLVTSAGYYVVGTMTDWGIDTDYKLTYDSDYEMYELCGVTLATTDEFKVVNSTDGTINNVSWFPSDSANYGANGEITENGEYDIYFLQNSDGGDDWFGGCIYLTETSYTVGGNIAEIFGTEWASSDSNLMTNNAGVYSKTYTVTKAYNDVRVVVWVNGTSFYGDPDQTGFNLMGAGSFTVNFDLTNGITVTGEIVGAPSIGGKTEWRFGDTIEFGSEKYYYIQNNETNAVSDATGNVTLQYDSWDSYRKQHIVGLFISPTLYCIYIQPDDYDEATQEMPAGVKLISGNGTEEKPYRFDLIYDEAPPDPDYSSEVMIGDFDGASNDSYLPMNSLYSYSYTQQIYTAEEIGAAGTITSVKLWMYGNENLYEMPIDIYMLETDKDSFDSTADWIPVNAADKVYSGSVTVHNTDVEAFTFTLDTPFDYSGNGNLVLCFNNKTGYWKSGLNGTTFGVNTDPVRAIYARQDGTGYDPLNMTGIAATSTTYHRNVIGLGIDSATPAYTHTLSPVAQVDPYCTTPGKAAYYHCDVCGKDFEDDGGLTEIADIENWGILDPLGHNWGEPTYEWAADYSTCTATRVCSRDTSHIDTDTGSVTSEVTKPATETEAGERTYTATFIKSGFTTQTKKVDIPFVTGYTITFNPNHGNVTPESDITGADGRLAELPTPKRSGYSFRGWYTKKTGGEKVTTDTEFDKDTEIFAQWRENTGVSSSSTTTATYYEVSPVNTGNGSASVSPKNAAVGSTVTIIATPDEGYKLERILVTDNNGKEIAVIKKNGNYTFTMPDGKVDVAPVFIKIEADTAAPRAGSDNPFTDVKDADYFYDSVLWAVKGSITSGTTATTFSPKASCTRAQTVTFLWRAALSPEPTIAENPFTDVKEDDYFYKAVLWAYENDITLGTSDDKFSPDATVTRGQTVTFLCRLKGGTASGENPFKDVRDGDYYYNSVLWAAERGITSGTTDTTFSPADDCLRGQIVTFLYRCYK